MCDTFKEAKSESNPNKRLLPFFAPLLNEGQRQVNQRNAQQTTTTPEQQRPVEQSAGSSNSRRTTVRSSRRSNRSPNIFSSKRGSTLTASVNKKTLLGE